MVNISASTPQLKAVKEWIDSICSLDISKVVPLVSSNFKYQSFPKAIDLPEVNEQAKEEHIQWLGGLIAAFTKFEVIIHEVIEAPGKVVIHVASRAFVIDGTTYEYDSIDIISLVEEDGEIRILGCKDVCDPHKRSALYAGVAKAVAQRVPGS